jgi:hypothetical protein
MIWVEFRIVKFLMRFVTDCKNQYSGTVGRVFRSDDKASDLYEYQFLGLSESQAHSQILYHRLLDRCEKSSTKDGFAPSYQMAP